ncbi:hypothetical protein ACHAXR_005580 [Thalassiosira sp. AJA248-18]
MTMDSTEILSNNDVLLRTMEFLGPRHVCIGIGATCQHLHQLSKCNSLWRVFWEARCLSPSDEDSSATAADDNEEVFAAVHKAAIAFQHAVYDMDLTDKIFTSCMVKKRMIANEHNNGEKYSESDGDGDGENTTLLYSAYIQKHTMMKLTNLRVGPFGHQLKKNELEQSNLESPLCTQTWPGQLSLVVDEAIEGNMRNNHRVTCLNSAESWCDHPTCNEARCGPTGCMRCYRFLPRDYSLSATGQLARGECTERNYDLVSFVKCSWCSVSFCNQHVDRYYDQKQRGDRPPAARRASSWYKCDECQLSSCPDCVSQIFLSPPDVEGCKVVTAGKVCRRDVCKNCMWYIGKEKKQHDIKENIPGGDYSQSIESAEIVTMKGVDVLLGGKKVVQWEDGLETSCSKCLRHVEFRLKELAQVQESFGGFMP